ncbi:MAG TPA: hypothetical protein VIY73_16795, partial [Polyangiaceae bacterium]
MEIVRASYMLAATIVVVAAGACGGRTPLYGEGAGESGSSSGSSRGGSSGTGAGSSSGVSGSSGSSGGSDGGARDASVEASPRDTGAPDTGPPAPACPPPPPPSGGAGPGTPEVFASVTAPTGLAIDATNLYVVSTQAAPVTVLPLAGGAASTLDALGQYSVTVNDTDVFTVAGSELDDVISRCAKTGCTGGATALETLQAGADHAHMAATSHALFVASEDGPASALPLDAVGNTTPSFAYGMPPVFARGDVVVSQYSDQYYPGAVATVSNGRVVTLVEGETDGGRAAYIVALTADCTNAYYVSSSGVVSKVPLAGGPPTTLATVDVGTVVFPAFGGTQMTVDATRLYLTTVLYSSPGIGYESGSIVAIPVDGGA